MRYFRSSGNLCRTYYLCGTYRFTFTIRYFHYYLKWGYCISRRCCYWHCNYSCFLCCIAMTCIESTCCIPYGIIITIGLKVSSFYFYSKGQVYCRRWRGSLITTTSFSKYQVYTWFCTLNHSIMSWQGILTLGLLIQ